MLKRQGILETAIQLITKTRLKEHGNSTHQELSRGFVRTAKLWSAYLGIAVSPKDVALLLVLLKASRAKANGQNEDNYVDIGGYAGIAGELALESGEEW